MYWWSNIAVPEDVELMQHSIPKVDAGTLRPAVWPENPELEWCPPGHGDLYPSLLGSGWLERLLELYREGVVQPVIAERFSFDEAAQAHHYIQDRKNFGKVVLTP